MRKKTAKLITIIFPLIVSFLFLLLPFPAQGFFEWEREDLSIDTRGMIRIFGVAYENRGDDSFFEEKSDLGIAGIGRLILEAQAWDQLDLEMNAYQTCIASSFKQGQIGLTAPLDVERSAALEWSLSNNDYMHLAIDQLALRWSWDPIDLVLGRQPINLATTFFFTPNDFFAPFSAQAFYRVYKPGVDAVRAEVRLGELSQLSLISVLGYKNDLNSDTGWSDDPDSNRTSYLGRISTVFRDCEWAILGGRVRETDIIGASFQGELFQWLGVRTEGHAAYPDDPEFDPHLELSVGIEHHWENSLDIRLEYFYHGSGADSVSEYATAPAALLSESFYLGRDYTALGVGFQFTPLLTTQLSAISNLNDHSHILSFYAVYSLADEAELVINLGVPLGEKLEDTHMRSEFGAYPYSGNIEVRWYF